ncbi:MAG: hypothetical protein LBM18_06335 [Oscillospiraceae bacterium]|jgi:hypothetical protein|nr:hypothetical protein [Oscillospiraceae bacterium]
MESFGVWIRGIAVTAIICGAALAITPKSRVKGVLKTICGVLVVIAILSPFIDGEGEFLSMDLAEYRAQAAFLVSGAEKEQTNLSRSIIEGQLGSYILDKAQTLGFGNLAVSLGLKWGDEGYWYPYDIELRGFEDAPPGAINALSVIIESELGIPSERQYWKTGGEEQ